MSTEPGVGWFEEFDRLERDARRRTRRLIDDIEVDNVPLDSALSALERLQGLAERRQALAVKQEDDRAEFRQRRRDDLRNEVVGWMTVIVDAVLVIATVWLLLLAITGQLEPVDLIRRSV